MSLGIFGGKESLDPAKEAGCWGLREQRSGLRDKGLSQELGGFLVVGGG